MAALKMTLEYLPDDDSNPPELIHAEISVGSDFDAAWPDIAGVLGDALIALADDEADRRWDSKRVLHLSDLFPMHITGA